MNPYEVEQGRINRISLKPQKNAAGAFGKKLEEIPLIKLLPDEKVLCVQRQHWLVLFGNMILLAIFPVVLILLLLFPPFQRLFSAFPQANLLGTYILLTSICAFLVFESFAYLNWYYQFYIITSRCIVHIHFFRLGGFFFKEVFFHQVRQQEITRHAPNLVFDLLNLYDVTMHFSELDRPQPFIFKTPSNSELIEDILEDITVKEMDKEERK